MPAFHAIPPWMLAACMVAAFVVTLVLAAWLTPRHWWRRANARALAVLAGGTALCAWLFVLGVGALLPRPVPVAVAIPVAQAIAPVLVRTYRVHDDLNVRTASGTGAARIAVVPGGSRVSTTGRRDGDWWEVTASVNGHTVTGWASSLWLRRDDEAHARR